jgi:predicted Rossmann fold flavoprotein
VPAPERLDVLVLGAGAAGLMCAATAAARGRRVLVLERNARLGLKILVSGGGRANFTNRSVSARNYVSDNADFARSALARFTPDDFLALIHAHGVPYHERKHGQLFCDDSARSLLRLLLAECEAAGAAVRAGVEVSGVERVDRDGARFVVRAGAQTLEAGSLVVATGGLSWPRLGVSDFGHRLARQLGLRVVPLRPGLVPLLWSRPDARRFGELAGIAVPARVRCGGAEFEEALLFTHGGLSGPAILQASNYWRLGGELLVDLLPGADLAADLAARRAAGERQALRTVLAECLPRRLLDALLEADVDRPLAQCADRDFAAVAAALQRWRVQPASDAGWDKAEVTLGGVDTRDLSSRTLEAREVPGVYFIGEVVDVTGWLGGFNFQWAWASGRAAGEAC